MSQVMQCDTCKKIVPPPEAANWLYLVQQDPEPSFLSSMTGGGTSISGSFCTIRCVAEYAVARALTEGLKLGERP